MAVTSFDHEFFCYFLFDLDISWNHRSMLLIFVNGSKSKNNQFAVEISKFFLWQSEKEKGRLRDGERPFLTVWFADLKSLVQKGNHLLGLFRIGADDRTDG